ncbi:MAG: endonuclease [Bacteroidota bacterium]
MKKFTLVLFCVFFYFLSFAQIPAGYYDNAAGKTGDVLRAALRVITTTGHVKLPYTSTSFDVWDAYAITDVRPAPNNTIIWDMYSEIPNGSNYTFTIFTNQCGSASAEGDCYAREHLTPNSWWGGIDNLANPQYTDLHHLFPADQYVNNKKSAHPLGQSTAPTWTSSNGGKIGPCSWPGYTGTIFEPINEYKGDFARATFYIAARYMDSLSIWVTRYPSTEAQYVINSSGNNFKQWYIDMLITWSNNDPVSQKEIERNNAIYYNTPQTNRNPFVDHPEYVCEIWTSTSCTDAPSITNIANNPISPNSSNSVSVTGNVTDNGSVTSVTLQWCTDGTSFGDTITMNVSGAPNYMTASSIPANAGGTTIYYTITAIDNESNTSTSPVQSYTILKDEPTNHASVFTCGTTTSSSIPLTWTDASGGTTPDGYLIKASSVSYAAINNPVDGVTEANSTFVHSVTPGTQTYAFTGLSQSTTYYFKVFPYTNSLSNINYKTSTVIPTTSCATTAKLGCATDLIISEYIEGSGSNKYIEIYNNTGASVNLSNYSLQLFSNGSPTVSTNNALSGTLNNQATIVYKLAAATIYGGTTTNNTALNFSGDDAVALFKISDSSYVDIFGRIGEDPGTAWTSGAFTTLDKTLVRNSSVTTGITTNPTSGFQTLSTEWTQYATDNITHLGAHTMDCPSCASPTVNSNSLSFSTVTQSSITINWLNGDGNNRLVVGKEGSAISNTPLDGTTYSANSTFGSGNILGAGEYVVYNDSGSSITISNLAIGSTYYFTIFEYNCGAGSEIYLSPGASENQVTYSIVTGSTNDNSFCITPTTGYSTGIMFISTGGFNSNTYTAQLSDLAGSFASPVNIGTLISNSNSEVIDCIIPANTPTGTGYKIRVVSDGPILTGTNSDPFEIILNPPPTGAAAQTFCNSATVADLAAIGTAIQWYAASGGDSALTTTTALVNGSHYFASQTLSGCESATRFDVTVTINVPAAPTGTATQTFCNSGTVANLLATGTAIQWYAASTGGAALATTTALISGTHYFASQTISSCESNTRFDVTATINVPAVPTGTATQTFCNSGTVANLLATGTNIQWYAASSGGSALATTAALVNSSHYFATQTISSCESNTRFDVTATINVPAVPTGTATQTFCNSGTVANLLATGTAIQWYAASGGGSALATTTALANGSHYFASQTLSGCESATRFDVTASINVPAVPTGTATQTFCNSGTVANLLASGTAIKWYAASSGGAALATTTTLVNGSHYFASQTISSCESATRFDVTITLPPTPIAPTLGTITQPTCSTATGSVVLNNLPSGNWTINPGNISGTTTSTTISGLTISATYNYTVTNASGCSSVASSNIVINAQPTAPGAPTASTTIQPTCALATGTIVVTAPTGGYEYNIDGGTYQTSLTFAGIAAGSHNILVRRTSDNTCISTASTIIVNAQPTAPASATASTTIQPTCALATGTIVITAPTSGYEYNIDGGTYQTSLTFAGIAAGSHSILVRRTSDNTCISTASTIIVNAQPTAPVAATATTTIQPTCTLATGTIVITAPTSGFEYKIDAGAYQTSLTFAGIAAGSHNILVRRTSDNTCISTASTAIVNAQPTAPAAATASTTIQPTCALATGTVVVTAPTTGSEYKIDASAYQASATFTGVAAGSHNILVRRTSDNTCISTASVVIVNAQPTAPASATASTTIQPTCALATGTIVVTAPTTGYEYKIDAGAYQTSLTFAGIAAGSHNILVRRTSDNTCISTASTAIVNAQPTAPVAATATTTIQPTCALATGTIVVTAPTTGYEYKIDGGAYQTSLTFAGIAAGSHNILVRRTSDNTCISTAATIIVNAQPTAPTAATASTTIQPTCALATGTIVVTAPTAGYEYNIDAGTYQSSLTFAGIAAGSHNILVRRTPDNTCISSPTAVAVNAQPTAPAAASATTTHPTCALATGTIVVTAPLGAYEYKIDVGNYQASATFAGIAAGSHTILVRRTSDNTCISSPATVIVNAQPTAPAAATASTTIQPTCALATGTIVVTAPTGAYEYKIDAGAYQVSTTFAGIAAGSHNILVRRTSDNTCISTASTAIVNAQPTAPVAATATTTIQPTCALATGTIVVTAPTGGYEYKIDAGAYQASATFTGIAAGSHNILVRKTSDNTCISSTSTVIVNAQPTAPAAATANTTIQPTCALATGTIVVTAPTGGYEYNIDAGTYQSSLTFTGIAAGSHNILVRKTSDNTCISSTSTVIVNAQPTAPAAATANTTIQPTCALATGTIVVTAPTGGYEYNIDAGTYQSSLTFAGIAAGSHNILVRRTSDNTCISTASTEIVNAQPTAPAAATASTTIQPTCALATGTIVITAPTSGYEYNIDGGTYQTSLTFAGIAAGSHSILVRRTSDNTCISTASTIIVNAQPTAPASATASITIQPTCALATGTIVITAPTTGYEYKIDAGGYQTSLTFAGIAAGSHNILVRRTSDNTCISIATTVTVNAQPTTPATPIASVTAHPTCTLATGIITVTSPNPGLTFSIDGSDYTNTTGVFIAVAPNTYNITARNSDGCISSATIVLINAQPLTPSAPIAASSQTFCNSATIANLSATGTMIQWYDTSTGGAALATTTVLINGNHYFASQTIGICESTTRFDVTATIDAPAAPTGIPTQTFCDSGTVANLTATGNAIQWYTDSTGGSALATTTALVNGLHYFASQTLNSCESATRLDVTVTINQTPYLTSTLDPDTICSNSTFSYMPTSSITNSTFYWIRNSVTGISNLAGSGTGNPNETLINTTAASVNVTYVYTVASEGCINETTNNVIIQVNPLPTVSLLPFTTVCSQTAEFVLTGGLPTGGTYAGTGVITGMFYPGSADTMQTISYIITDSNSCSNAASENIAVLDCTEIEENALSQGITVYPNPTNGMFNIAIKNSNLTELFVSVIDIQGKVIFSALEKNILIGYKKQIDLGGLAKGIYYIKLTTDTDVQIQKLIIE